MLTRNQDTKLHSRKMRMEIPNQPHMEDCLAHCRQHGIEDRLIAALWAVVQRFSLQALGGEEVIVKFIPNSRTQPTFAWHALAQNKLLETGRVDYSETTRHWTCIAD